jgi:hypothetical protein
MKISKVVPHTCRIKMKRRQVVNEKYFRKRKIEGDPMKTPNKKNTDVKEISKIEILK